MPRLLFFVACEKVIVDQRTNVISLMSLLDDVNVQIPPNAPPPPSGAVIPMQWTIVSTFLAEPGDTGKQFEQRSALVNSNETPLVQTPVALFSMTGAQHRIISQINGMPVGTAARLTLRCYFREKGTNVWQTKGEGYPINIKWQSSSIIVH